MDLRSGTRTGPVPQLSGPAKDGFEEGVGIIFSEWTALVLAVENQWGGSESASKADYFIEDILGWFYKKKGEAWGSRLIQAEKHMHCFRVPCTCCGQLLNCWQPSRASTPLQTLLLVTNACWSLQLGAPLSNAVVISWMCQLQVGRLKCRLHCLTRVVCC